MTDRPISAVLRRFLALHAPFVRNRVERELDEATITAHDESGLVVVTRSGRAYGLAFNRKGGRDVLGVTELDPFHADIERPSGVTES